MTKNVIVVCAHSDDQAFGPGGTIAKLADEGYSIHTIIFSYGEMSHPWLQPEVIAQKRKEEAEAADKILKGSGVTFLGLKEGQFEKEGFEKEVTSQLATTFKELDPVKIFTHPPKEPHHDHREVHKQVVAAYDQANMSCPLYAFNVYSIFDIQQPNFPALSVDISKTFKQKIQALRCFKSQISFFSHAIFNNILFLLTFFKGFFNGLRFNTKFAEVFYRIR